MCCILLRWLGLLIPRGGCTQPCACTDVYLWPVP